MELLSINELKKINGGGADPGTTFDFIEIVNLSNGMVLDSWLKKLGPPDNRAEGLLNAANYSPMIDAITVSL